MFHPRRFDEHWREFAPTFLGSLLGAMALGVVGNAAYSLLTSRWTTISWWRVVLIAVASLVLAGAVRLIQSGLARRVSAIPQRVIERVRQVFVQSRPSLGVQTNVVEHRAVILFVSGGSGTSHETALAHHIGADPTAPVVRSCLLLYSDLSKEKADLFAAATHNRYGDHIAFDGVQIADVTLIKDCYDGVQAAIDKTLAVPLDPPLAPKDIIYDVTGGTAVVTAGGVLAALNRGIEMEYVRPGPAGPLDFRNGTVIRVDVDDDWVEVHPGGRAGAASPAAAAPVPAGDGRGGAR